MANLAIYATSCIEAGISGQIGREYDHDNLADAAREQIGTEADSACIYTSECQDIISRYESEYGSDADDMGGQFKASEWQDAMQAYAYGVASNAISAMLETELGEIEAKADALREESGNDELTVGRDCPFGFIAHQSETAEGVLYWADVEGGGPKWAIDCGAFWLWADKVAEEDSDETPDAE